MEPGSSHNMLINCSTCWTRIKLSSSIKVQ